MSNIYILEPPTSGKVLFKTTVGDIDVELWAKETPKTCRNFIQLCLEGYYNGLKFHRIVKGFIAQGGDPNGDGSGGESIYGEPFKDEFHQRLRFARRGLLAMANAGKDDNGSQFFFTLAATPELQQKHTIFGKVTGDTVFNMLKLEDGVIHDETPEFPHKIISTEVLNNPFSDIEPRIREPAQTSEPKKKKDKRKGVKDFKLLSFGNEAEEDEEENIRESVKFASKGKSTHDVLDDPKLSATSDELPSCSHVDDDDDKVSDKDDHGKSGDDDDDDEAAKEAAERRLQAIKLKLSSRSGKKKKSILDHGDPDKDIDDYYQNNDRDNRLKEKMKKIKEEIQSVKKDYHKNKIKQSEEKAQLVEQNEESEKAKQHIKEYQEEYDKYVDLKKKVPKKGSQREEQTLALLEKFKAKLAVIKNTTEGDANSPQEEAANEDTDKWMTKHLRFQDDDPVLAKDANTKDDDWFEIYDPRNKLNKRRRGETTTTSKKPKT